jgi:hypothetical protein
VIQKLYKGRNNLIAPGSDPTIDNGGLLFVNGSGGEINLFT